MPQLLKDQPGLRWGRDFAGSSIKTEKSIELKIRADSANATQNISQVADALAGKVGEQATKAA